MSLIIFMTSDRPKFFVISVLLTAFLGYSIFLYSTLPIKQTPLNKEADAGKFIWQKYNCNACHQVYGLGGYLGPDLTNAYSFRGKAYIKAFLNAGVSAMPNFHLTDSEINDLLAYLKDMDTSGQSDPRSFTINYDGTIQQ